MSLLDERSVLGYAADRGIVTAHAPASTRLLSGGVSNVVLLVEQDGRRVVVKQALGKLRVADDWYAERSRAQAEAAALRVVRRLTPARVPAVLDDNPEAYALIIEAAPPDWITWKERLFANAEPRTPPNTGSNAEPRTDPDTVEPAVARWLGETLHHWHAATAGVALPAILEGVEAFGQLRIEPYFAVSARRAPQWAPQLERYARALTDRARRTCLVSGDFSPKNVLVAPAGRPGCWVIDWEVAHRGDPSFDVAFLLTHLLLKAVHLPSTGKTLHRCAVAFLDGYADGLGCADPAYLHGLIGALLLARVVGSSPAEYLTTSERPLVAAAAGALLDDPPERFETVWHRTVSR